LLEEVLINKLKDKIDFFIKNERKEKVVLWEEIYLKSSNIVRGNIPELAYKYLLKKVKLKVSDLIKETNKYNKNLKEYASHVIIILI
jgi:hypothetical protein